jgi:hypothetical protein
MSRQLRGSEPVAFSQNRVPERVGCIGTPLPQLMRHAANNQAKAAIAEPNKRPMHISPP